MFSVGVAVGVSLFISCGRFVGDAALPLLLVVAETDAERPSPTNTNDRKIPTLRERPSIIVRLYFIFLV